jgi:hypothetical protein
MEVICDGATKAGGPDDETDRHFVLFGGRLVSSAIVLSIVEIPFTQIISHPHFVLSAVYSTKKANNIKVSSFIIYSPFYDPSTSNVPFGICIVITSV